MSNRVSKFLSLVLRHDPAKIGIVLDDAGWTDVATLLAACAAHGVSITRAELEQVVATSDKQRFKLDGDRIRASQGHSVDVDLRLAPATPPAVLYHGTIEASLAGIREPGLVRGERHHVHLSADVETAKRVGGRRGAPIVLDVRAGDMHANGYTFFRSDNGVWLVEHVPIEFVTMPARKSAGGGDRSTKVTIAKTTLAACDDGHYTNAHGQRVELAAAIAEARDTTVLHDLETDRLRPAESRHATAISVTGESTLVALARIRGDHVAALNFASAKNPGGGFLGGAQAQEETLARSSALYICQCAHPELYERNRANRSALYLDLALFSPRVPVFRDDDGGWLDAPVLASIITCPAPNVAALRQQNRLDHAPIEATLRRRADFVLAIAAHHGVDRLVLGAWGAGVFGNDPALVARVFAELLRGRFAGVFVEVVFAVLGDRATSANHAAFADAFA